MTRLINRSVSSFLILALIFCPQAIGGNDGARTASETKAGVAPVGAVESLGAIKINGRAARSGTALWGNELLQAPAIESARMTLDGIGLISLSGGSMIKLVSILREDGEASTLFAYLLTGAMTIRLNGRSSARICAGNSIFAVSPGSSARLLVSEGRGRVLSSSGATQETSDWSVFRAALAHQDSNQSGAQMTPGEYKIQPYNFTFGLGGYADIEARSVRYLQFRVTDKDDNPEPDLLLLILLKNRGDSSDSGSINYGATMMRVATDHNGMVTVRFDAGITIGAVSAIEVTIAKNNQTLKGNIRIVKPKGFWTLKNAGPVMATVATAAVAAIAARPYSREIPKRPPVSADEPVVIP